MLFCIDSQCLSSHTASSTLTNQDGACLHYFQRLASLVSFPDGYRNTKSCYATERSSCIAQVKPPTEPSFMITEHRDAGGVRCERASSLVKAFGSGFEDVCQLQGGVHAYMETFPDGGALVRNVVQHNRECSLSKQDISEGKTSCTTQG
jgi:hypothetical protein